MTAQPTDISTLHSFWLETQMLPVEGEKTALLQDLSDRIEQELSFAQQHDNGEKAAQWQALTTMLENEAIAALTANIFENSVYLRDLILRQPLRFASILSQDPKARIQKLVNSAIDERPETEALVMKHLRLIKQDAALTIGLADIARLWTVKQVTNALTDIADNTLRGAIRFLLRENHRRGKLTIEDLDNPEKGSGYFALAMGKHGAGELNYSSDIDLIVLYDADIAPCKDKWEMGTTFVRLTKQLVKIMQDRTADGYVFRTDLRLRPDPGATPPAMAVLAALQYYESMGQNWERAALIKARTCAGDIAAGDSFLAEIAPFIWRKYFDYAALADVHSIKRQIHAHKGHGEIAIKGHNVKLGRGGIREIEFFVQTQQLIAGGRNPALRGRETIPMLSELVELTWIEPQARDELTQAYEFLRQVEHRIQMQRDEQTHNMPQMDDGVMEIARMMGFDDLDAFKQALRGWLECVQGHYAGLFEEEEQLGSGGGNLVFTGEEDDPGTLETLATMGYKQPSEVTKAIRAWHFGRYPATRSTKARERLTELTPALLQALAKTENADQAFLSFNSFIAALPSGVQVFSLLRNNPHMLETLATILGTSPRLAQTVGRRPRVIDSLLDPAFFGDMLERENLNQRLSHMLSEATCYEDALDGARIFGQEQNFLIGVRILTGAISASQAGAAYAMLAGVIIRHMLKFSQQELERRHGKIPGGKVAVIAMGKLGGREMTAGSDLDLMLLYDFDPDASWSDGDKPLAPSQYYTRLTQRLITALSVPTGEGELYEVDFRLRPSGNSGPLATSLSSFRSYHEKDAWTWEHMALTRARIIAADEGFSDIVRSEIVSVLAESRDADTIKKDVAEMRARIQEEKGTSSPWKIKQVAGGMVDIEFIAQTLQLIHADKHPKILHANTAETLRLCVDEGLLSSADADNLMPAIRLYHNITQILRICLSESFDPETASSGLKEVVARAGEEPNLKQLELRLQDYQQNARACFERMIAPVKVD